MLTRKHFIRGAATIAKKKTRKQRRSATAMYLRTNRDKGLSVGGNPRFDRKRFKKAAGAT